MIHWPAPVADGPVRGLVVVPGSKSASARSLLLAALAEASSTLTGVLDSRDVLFFLSVIGFSLFTTSVILRTHRAG